MFDSYEKFFFWRWLRDTKTHALLSSGYKSMDELGSELVDVGGLGVHSVPTPVDSLSSDVYDRLVLPPFAVKSKL